jgi:WD40 repeat protein
MWRIADHSSPLIEICAHDSKITNIKLSPDNRSFVTTDDGGIIRLWPILSTAQLRDRFNESPASVEATPATTTKPLDGEDHAAKPSAGLR